LRGGEEMDKKQIISTFVQNRPEALGAYGYGSGVFRQVGYDQSDNPQIDLIFLVSDLKAWHHENMKMNREDYSFTGRVYVCFSNIEKLKGNNRITYYSQIYENGYRFKYGVMEEMDFLSFLYSWDNFFIAGRFQKPTLQIKGNPIEEAAIKKNQEQALLVAALLAPNIIPVKEFYKIICNLSYAGTLRMYVAENPHKVENIVNGSYERFNSIYNLNTDYMKEMDNGTVIINHDKALKHVEELPIGLFTYLYENDYDFTNLYAIRYGISTYLNEHNKAEEIAQTFDSIKTNGISRSTPYLLAKVKKRVSGL